MNRPTIPRQGYYKTIDPRSLSASVVKAAIREILFIAEKRIKKPIKELLVLDVGSSDGRYSFEIEKYVKKVVGIEPFFYAYKKALGEKRKNHSQVNFFNVAIENFNTEEKFDLVICLTTIEHMPKAKESFKQIFRLMPKGGIIYLTAPNKLWPYDHHYELPFLSWLPLSLANLYVRVTGRGFSYEDSAYSKTYFGIKRFFNQFPCKYDLLLPNDSKTFYIGCGTGSRVYKIIKNLGMNLIAKFPFFWIVSKGFIMVIKKA